MRGLMQSRFGKDWYLVPVRGDRRADVEVEAIEEILWWMSKNDLFEYPMGLCLLYFWFPEWYQCQALTGVPVYYQTWPHFNEAAASAGPQ
jgi:hypothetical protein